MTAIEFDLLNSPSSSPSNHICNMPTKTRHTLPVSFFNDLSYLKQWSEIEATLASASTCVNAGNDSEIGWLEGRVHETRSTQKEVEILLVQPLQSRDADDIADQKKEAHEAHEALRIFITCPELIRFVFALNQIIKVSLKGARIIHELVPHGSGLLPFSLVFSSFLSIQSVRGGACIADGDVIDTRRGNDRNTENSLLESETSKMSIDETLLAAPRSSPKLGQDLALGDSTVVDASDDYTAYPPLTSLTEGMMTPLLGIVETVKPPSTTTTDELCVSLTIADASSYEFRRGFRVTCFAQKSRLARELPTPSEGDVILLKSVKICKWSGALFGTVYHAKLDWISYKPKTDTVTVPQHAKSGPVDSFYGDLEGRREMFKQFVKAIESGSWNSNNLDVK
ncbi:hypothetical protein ACEPAG_7440 [Sanghuangporus baumii]